MTVFFKNKEIRHPEPAEGREGSPAAVFRRPGWTSHDFRPLVSDMDNPIVEVCVYVRSRGSA